MTSEQTLVTRDRERGAVLIVALIFMLILSFIGVSSMQGTSMQEKMSGNLRDRYSAFNAAEAALLEGERQAVIKHYDGSLDADNPANGVYVGAFADNDQPPTWKVEQVGAVQRQTSAGELIGYNGVVIKVTASSGGRSGQSNVVLESIYLVE